MGIFLPAGGLLATCGIAVGASAGTSGTYRWGDNTLGDQLGNGTTDDALVPTLISGTTAFTHVSLALETLGSQHGCALDAAGKAYCWGANRSYEVGDGTQGDRLVPTAVLDR